MSPFSAPNWGGQMAERLIKKNVECLDLPLAARPEMTGLSISPSMWRTPGLSTHGLLPYDTGVIKSSNHGTRHLFMIFISCLLTCDFDSSSSKCAGTGPFFASFASKRASKRQLTAVDILPDCVNSDIPCGAAGPGLLLPRAVNAIEVYDPVGEGQIDAGQIGNVERELRVT